MSDDAAEKKPAHTYRKFEKHIYQRVDRDGNVVPETWALKVDIGRHPNTGQRRTRWFTVKGGIREARRELAKIQTQVHKGTQADPGRQTIKDYLDFWLKDHVKPGCAMRTYDDYAQQVNRRIIPHLGAVRLANLKPVVVKQFHSDLAAAGHTPHSIKRAHKVLSQAMNTAVELELLEANPCARVRAPKAPTRTMQILTPAEALQVLEQLKDTRLYIPVLLAVMTGMRIGEICALHWRDVDLDSDKPNLQVRFAVERTYEGLKLKEPKTERSRRRIALDAIVVEALRAWRLQQKQERLRVGPAYEDHDLVVCRMDGKIIHPTSISVDFGRIVRLMGFKVRFHDLRHSHISHLLMAGVHAKVASERAGHSTIAITMDTYSHVLPGLQEDAAAKTGDMFRNAMATQPLKKSGA